MNMLRLSLAPALRTLCLLAGGTLMAQMEKRADDLYDRAAFRSDAPAVGAMAPDLVLTDLDGRLQVLSALRGRVVVIIKAGFT